MPILPTSSICCGLMIYSHLKSIPPSGGSHDSPSGHWVSPQQNTGVSATTHAPFSQARPGAQSHALTHELSSPHIAGIPVTDWQIAPVGQVVLSQQNIGLSWRVHKPSTQRCPAVQSQAVVQASDGHWARTPLSLSHAIPDGHLPASQQKRGSAPSSHRPEIHVNPGLQSHAVSHEVYAQTSLTPEGVSQISSGGQNEPPQQYTGSLSALQKPSTHAIPGVQSQAL